MINEQLKSEFEDDRKYYGKNLILVKANPDKGFNYPFYLYIPPVDPSQMKTSIIMDCLNDYEEELPEGMRENSKVIETVYGMFSNNTVIGASENGENTNESDVQEEESKSFEIMHYRMAKAMGPINKFHKEGFPVMVPIIPGFKGTKVEGVNQVESQLDKDVIERLAPQIKAMYEYAREIIKVKVKVEPGKPKVEINGIINFGYSKSSIFASNFMAYYPELCKGGFFGCGSLGTLPLDSITLKIVDKESNNQSAPFYKGENGEIIKEVTKEEYNRISKEYNKDKEKREHQKDIVEVEKERTYIVPLNFPLGIADIEHYRTDLSEVVIRDEAGNVVKRGKEAYRELLAKIQTKIFVSEYEESRTGTYAYKDTPVKDGSVIQAGTDMEEVIDSTLGNDWLAFQKELDDNNLGNVELAGMSNRILESINLVNAVFGRSVNERFHSYRQLYELIGANVQTRIYKGFSHYNDSFCTIGEGEERIAVFDSQNLWKSDWFKEDFKNTFKACDKGENLQLSDNEGTIEAVSPVFQLCRRYLANGGNIQSLVGLKVADLNSLFNDLVNKKKLSNESKDRLFDELTSAEIESVIIRAREAADGKDGLEDVLDSGARSGEVVGATGVVMSAQRGGNDKVIPDESQSIS